MQMRLKRAGFFSIQSELHLHNVFITKTCIHIMIAYTRNTLKLFKWLLNLYFIRVCT